MMTCQLPGMYDLNFDSQYIGDDATDCFQLKTRIAINNHTSRTKGPPPFAAALYRPWLGDCHLQRLAKVSVAAAAGRCKRSFIAAVRGPRRMILRILSQSLCTFSVYSVLMLTSSTCSHSTSEQHCKLTLHFKRVERCNFICVNGEPRALISRTINLCNVHQHSLSEV
jgi:hypothetical protein